MSTGGPFIGVILSEMLGNSISRVVPGLPAERAGLRAGDVLESADGVAFHEYTQEKPYVHSLQTAMHRRRPGEKIKLGVKRVSMTDGKVDVSRFDVEVDVCHRPQEFWGTGSKREAIYDHEPFDQGTPKPFRAFSDFAKGQPHRKDGQP